MRMTIIGYRAFILDFVAPLLQTVGKWKGYSESDNEHDANRGEDSWRCSALACGQYAARAVMLLTREPHYLRQMRIPQPERQHQGSPRQNGDHGRRGARLAEA